MAGKGQGGDSGQEALAKPSGQTGTSQTRVKGGKNAGVSAFQRGLPRGKGSGQRTCQHCGQEGVGGWEVTLGGDTGRRKEAEWAARNLGQAPRA